MRALALMVMAITTVLVSATARAQTYAPGYPVCMQAYGGQAGYIDCSYTSLAQCNATASGRSGQCLINPFFSPPNERRISRRPVR
jgi:hypothetical protein